jgi:hypothetical protein
MGQKFASFWFGGDLPSYSKLCIQSFLDHGHSFHLYSYDSDLKVPDGCVLHRAAEIYSRDKVFFYRGDEYRGDGEKVSAFSNMFRYRMIHETGVCWVDTDVLCVSPAFPTSEFLFAREDVEFFNGAVLRFPAGHEAMRLAAEHCWEVRSVAKWGDLGPRLMTRLIAEYGLEGRATPTQLIYPLHWREAMLVFDPAEKARVFERTTGSLTLHLWNEILTLNGIDTMAPPPAGSYLAETIERHRANGLFSN